MKNFKKLTKNKIVPQGDDVGMKAFKFAFVSIVLAAFTLIHYIHYMDIKYSTTILSRFFYFFILFYIIIYIAMYYKYEMSDIFLVYFIIMSIPYLYYLGQYIIKLSTYLTLNTVKGRIYILTSFLTLFAIGLITDQTQIIAIILFVYILFLGLRSVLSIVGEMLQDVDK